MPADLWSAISRRALLGASITTAAGSLLPKARAAAATAVAAGAVHDDILLHRKLRFRTDPGLVFWWLQGIKYGQVGTTLTPLYTNLVGTLQRITPTPDGGFSMTMLEMTMLLDVAGQEPLEEWRNPYTGEVLPVKLRPVGPTTIQYRADNSRVLPKELGGARLESEAETLPAVINGDDVFIADKVHARVFRQGREHPYVVNDLSHYHGSLKELSDPAVSMATATVSFAEVTGWQSWMNMGDRPGTLTSRTFGAKVARFDDMPAIWRRLLAEQAPEVAEDPVGSLRMPAAPFVR